MGLMWAVMAPIATLGVATLVFGGIARVDTGRTPYPLFALSAIVPWSFLASSLTAGIPSVTQALSMISRFSFPRMVFPLSAIGTSFIDLGVSVAVFLSYLVLTRTSLPATALWFIPLLAIETAFVVGIVVLASAMNVFARDIKLMVPLAVQLWLLLTPVMYPLSAVPSSLRSLYLLNPMAGLAESFRQVLVDGLAPRLSLLVPAMVGAIVAFILGLWYFSAVERRFADVI
jgi:lipopolysaccharide transport system permease protein